MSEQHESEQCPESILKRLRKNKIISYAVVFATVISAIAGFTDTADKLYVRAKNLVTKNPENVRKIDSIWLRAAEVDADLMNGDGAVNLKDVSRGEFIRISRPWQHISYVEDPLPLLIQDKDGAIMERRRPPVADYQMLKKVTMGPGVYQILDVQTISEPSRTLVSSGDECPWVVYKDDKGNTIDVRDAPKKRRIWVRIQKTDNIYLRPENEHCRKREA